MGGQREPRRRRRAAVLDLFTQWGKFERESEKLQLFLGDGLLVTTHAGETVRHPLLLQRVQLEFDANKPRFTVMATGDPADLYTPLLRYLEVDPKRLLQFKERLAADELHPLGGQRTSEFLKDLVQTCWKDGVYFDSAQEAGRGKSPYVYRQPAFYLGNRNQGFTTRSSATSTSFRMRPSSPSRCCASSGSRPGAARARTSPRSPTSC